MTIFELRSDDPAAAGAGFQLGVYNLVSMNPPAGSVGVYWCVVETPIIVDQVCLNSTPNACADELFNYEVFPPNGTPLLSLTSVAPCIGPNPADEVYGAGIWVIVVSKATETIANPFPADGLVYSDDTRSCQLRLEVRGSEIGCSEFPDRPKLEDLVVSGGTAPGDVDFLVNGVNLDKVNQWDWAFGDESSDYSWINGPTESSATARHNYQVAPSSDASLVITSTIGPAQLSCLDLKSVEVPATLSCPAITSSSMKIGKCDPNGNRLVEVAAVLSASNSYEARLVNMGVNGEALTLDQVSGAGELELAHVGTYQAGDSLDMRLVVDEPAGCPDDQIHLPISLAKCPDPVDECPTVVWSFSDDECTDGSQRPVALKVTTDFDQDYTVRLIGPGGLTVDEKSGIGGLVLTYGGAHEGSASLDFKVEFTDLDCEPQGASFLVSKCFQELPDPTETVDPILDPPSWWPRGMGPPPDWLCQLWLVLNAFLLLATAFLIGLLFCFFYLFLGNAWLAAIAIVVTIVVAVVAFLSTLAHLLVCAWAPGACVWARWIPRLIFGFGVVAAAIVFVIYLFHGGASYPCLFGVIIEFAYFGSLAYFSWEILNEIGCQPLAIREIRLPIFSGSRD